MSGGRCKPALKALEIGDKYTPMKSPPQSIILQLSGFKNKSLESCFSCYVRSRVGGGREEGTAGLLDQLCGLILTPHCLIISKLPLDEG